VYELFITEGIP